MREPTGRPAAASGWARRVRVASLTAWSSRQPRCQALRLMRRQRGSHGPGQGASSLSCGCHVTSPCDSAVSCPAAASAPEQFSQCSLWGSWGRKRRGLQGLSSAIGILLARAAHDGVRARWHVS